MRRIQLINLINSLVLRLERNIPFVCLAIFLLSFTLCLLIDVRLGTYRTPEGSEVLNIAGSLADQGTFADAYGRNSGPSAHAAPLYPLLLAVLFRVFHIADEQDRVNMATFVSTVLAALHYALLPLFAMAARLRPRVGVAAGLLGALLPINHWMLTRGVFEYALIALWMVSFSIVTLYTWTRRRFHWKWSCVTGIASGLVLLTSPPFLIPMAALAIAGFSLIDGRDRRRFIVYTLIQGFVAALLLMPWVIRNERTFGVPIWSRSNTGLELQLSNNDMVTARWNGDVLVAMHPRLRGSEFQRVRSMGEIAYNRQKMQEATSWIASHKGRFVELTVERSCLFWFPVLKRPAQTVITALITLWAFAGMVSLWRFGAMAARFLLVLWVGTAIPLLPFQSSARLSLPIYWSFYFLAAYCLLEWTEKMVRGKKPVNKRFGQKRN